MSKRIRKRQKQQPTDRPSVLVIGGGFGGLAAIHALTRGVVKITLVDQRNFHTFQPLLYQVATAGLDVSDVAFPLRTIFGRDDNVAFRHGRVVSIDLDAKAVTLNDGTAIGYDALIVATGATAAFFSIEGAAEHSRPLYTLGDARMLRNVILTVLESADSHPAQYNNGAPSFVVVGGGATGVEAAGAISELLDVAVRRDRLQIDRKRTTVTIVDASDRLLSGFGTRSSKYALATLESRGVSVRLSSPVASVEAGSVTLADASVLRADVIIWGGGVTVAGTIASTLPGERARGGRVTVRADLSLEGHDEVFVIGDAAAVPLAPDRDELSPQLAQVAIQSGRHAAKQILATGAGRAREPFRYHDKGIMATIGRRAAVAELTGPPPLGGLVLRGTLGWLSWLGLHLVYLIGFRNRLVVCLNWLWRYLGWPSGPRIIVEDGDGD